MRYAMTQALVTSHSMSVSQHVCQGPVHVRCLKSANEAARKKIFRGSRELQGKKVGLVRVIALRILFIHMTSPDVTLMTVILSLSS